MRLLYLNYEYPPLGGGAANASRYLMETWRSQPDLSVDLVCASPDRTRVDEVSDRLRVHRLDIGKRGSIHYQSQADLLRYAWAAWGYGRRLASEQRYDGCLAFFGIPCGFVARKLGLPYIVSLRGSDVPGYNPRFALLDTLLFRRMSRGIWRGARAVVANSAGLKSLALKTLPEQSIEVIPNGADCERFSPAPERSPGKRLRVLCVSRLIARKGVDDLIRALHALTEPADLTIVGSGNLESELKALTSQLGIGERVTFLGAHDHEALPDLYRAADLFVLPSHNEGMSNTVLEALASGLPVLLTPTGGTEELLDEQVNGRLIQAGDPASIAAAITYYQCEPEAISAHGRASRARAEALSWSLVAEEYLQLCRTCFADDGARS